MKKEEGFVFETSYGDEDGTFYSIMEHGGIFNNVKHIKQSNH
jgi:hypothetical protein